MSGHGLCWRVARRRQSLSCRNVGIVLLEGLWRLKTRKVRRPIRIRQQQYQTNPAEAIPNQHNTKSKQHQNQTYSKPNQHNTAKPKQYQTNTTPNPNSTKPTQHRTQTVPNQHNTKPKQYQTNLTQIKTTPKPAQH